MLDLCAPAGGAFDFSSTCVRTAWSAFLPFGLVVLLSLPVSWPSLSCLRPFITLAEAEAFVLYDNSFFESSAVFEERQIKQNIKPSLIPGFAFVTVGVLEFLGYLSYLSYRAITSSQIDIVIFSAAFALTWLYTILRSILRPTQTVPYDTFAIYIMLFAGAVLQVAEILYGEFVGTGTDGHSGALLFVVVGNLVATMTVLCVVLRMPMVLPSEGMRSDIFSIFISPEDYTSLFQWITFSWFNPLIQRGRCSPLNEKDVWNLSSTLQSRSLFSKFSGLSPQLSLLRKLWVANSLDMILDFSLTILSVVFTYAGPSFLKRILDVIDSTSPSRSSRAQAFIYAFLALLCALSKSQIEIQHTWRSQRAGTRVRSELIAVIYEKALKRKDFAAEIAAGDQKTRDQGNVINDDDDSLPSDSSNSSMGKIVNLMSTDASRISMTVSSLFYIYRAPFEVIAASISLYNLLGYAPFIGYLVLLLAYKISSYLTKLSIHIQKKLLAARDRRMAIVNELIGGIKFIKFFAWEESWVGSVMESRETELIWLIRARINSVLFTLLWTTTPIAISTISFFVYVMQGNQLTTSVAFTAIALFSMLQHPLNMIPTWILQILETGVSINRIAVYLAEDEVDDQVSSLKRDGQSTYLDTVEEEEAALGIENGSFSWNQHKAVTKQNVASGVSGMNQDVPEAQVLIDEEMRREMESIAKFELRDINVRFPADGLSVITGPAASGKTALLIALLGEMTLLPSTPPGRVLMSKHHLPYPTTGYTQSISYAAQAPWLRQGTIRDNVLFGAPLDAARYHAVLYACALLPDLEVLEDGDRTEIGSRGISLSGGQKARVALARAAYARTRWVLLDDPLSAMDSGTAEWIVEKLLKGELMKNRTVVLVTHHIELVLPSAVYFLRMLDGRIDLQGKVEDLQAQGLLELDSDVILMTEGKSKEQQTGDWEPPEMDDDDDDDLVGNRSPKKLVQDEHREIGSVKWSIYKTYLMATSYWIWVFLISMIILSQALHLTEKIWIMIWGRSYKHEHPSNIFQMAETTTAVTTIDGHFAINSWPRAIMHPMFYVGIYALIGLAGALTGLASITAQYVGALWASRSLFRRLLESVVRATFRFHDTTPPGRILNRFGKDIETIDSSLTGAVQSFNLTFASFITTVLTILFVFPWFLIPALFIGLAYRELGIGYLMASRDLRRMESTTCSHIFSDFGELLEGIVTVRAFLAERRLLDALHKKIDAHIKMWYSTRMANLWLQFNFDALGALTVFITTLFSITMLSDGAGLAGICISSAMSFTSSVYWTCRLLVSLEMDFNSVERVVEYLDLSPEPPSVIKTNRPPASWPSSSNNTLVVDNLTVQYAPDLLPALHGISFALTAGERVGILGRTGSGKSTLAMSILRFVDPTQGRIVIDGIDISTIGTHDLRSRLTIIPQDAPLFSGTLRDNLDPFHDHTDAECLDVLRRCHMTESSFLYTTNAEGATLSLDTQISASGCNFSQGQRQLIAMARALLRSSSIIIMDEATSSVDFDTDAKLQATIREEFSSCLLLTVAHRLRTVIDYDRFIVLDRGQIVEFDTPWNLIQKEEGIFRTMCLKSGLFNHLHAAARNKAEQNSETNL